MKKIAEAQQKWDTEIGPLVAQAENSEQEDIITVVNPRPVDMTFTLTQYESNIKI